MLRRFLILSFFLGAWSSCLWAQISPGKLTRAHENLEGVDNCTQCHDQGNEITGTKCLQCHTEIRDAINAKHGFHYQNASVSCTNCHADHLGTDAGITHFDATTFDHRNTGYPLSGKHASVGCESCHTPKRIKDAVVAKHLEQYPHQSFLGLGRQCVDCHQDRHAGSVGTSCEQCHSSASWKPSAAFSHAATKFPLLGKHANVACVQCHETLKNSSPSEPMVFSVKGFDDCSACHKSPHGDKFSKQTCSSCHTPGGWKEIGEFDHSKTSFPLLGKHRIVTCEGCHRGLADKGQGAKRDFATKPFTDCTPCHSSPHAPSFSERSCNGCHTTKDWALEAAKNFDHALTSFPLRGKHAALECNACHKPGKKLSFATVYKLKKSVCTDCHEDKHKGQFTEKYGNDCSQCHTEDAYSPSTFSLDRHAVSRFRISGAHQAVACRDCHMVKSEWVFSMKSISCGSCHKDHHDGLFTAFMKEKSCDACHNSSLWKAIQFDHSQTSFPLIGQHTLVECSRCHVNRYKGTSNTCGDCHSDPHAGQFTDKGKTDCARCHTPIGRRALIFRHDIQSTFALTGAHANVECGACHKPEMRNGKIVVHYKPLSSKCESCHQGKL